MADEGTRYYWCEKCQKAVDPDGVSSDLVNGFEHWKPPDDGMACGSIPCGPVVVR